MYKYTNLISLNVYKLLKYITLCTAFYYLNIKLYTLRNIYKFKFIKKSKDPKKKK